MKGSGRMYEKFYALLCRFSTSGTIMAHIFFLLLSFSALLELCVIRQNGVRENNRMLLSCILMGIDAAIQVIANMADYLFRFDFLLPIANVLEIILVVIVSALNIYSAKKVYAFFFLELICFSLGYVLYLVIATILSASIMALFFLLVIIYIVWMKLSE